MDSELVIRSASNVTAQDVNQSLWTRNGSNSEGFIFGHIMVKGKMCLLILLQCTAVITTLFRVPASSVI